MESTLLSKIAAGVTETRLSMALFHVLTLLNADAAQFTVPDNCEITELKRRLEAKEWRFIESLKVFNSDDAESWLNVDLRQCEKCGSMNTLSAQLKTVIVDEKNRRSEKSTPLTAGLLITAAECSEIKRIGQKVAFAKGRS
jgi:hypothetical protein